MKPVVIEEKYKLAARGFLEALDVRLGSRLETAKFVLEAGKPLAEAYLGVPLTRETAKVLLASAIDAIYTDGPRPNQNADTQPVEVGPVDILNISKGRTISKYVKNIPGMPVTAELFHINLSPTRVTFEARGADWLTQWGRIAIIWQDGNELIIGEFDALRPNQRLKGLENIRGGYIQGRQPRKGQPVFFVIYDSEGSQRSTVAAGGFWK